MSSFRSAVVLAAAAAALSCGGKDVVCHGEGCAPDGPVPPIDPSVEMIYDDTLAPHWQTLAPWRPGCCVTSEQTFVKHAGTRALHVTAPAQDPPGVWLVRSDAANWGGNWYEAYTADYRALRAWIRFADAAAVPDLQLSLGDGSDAVGANVMGAPYLTDSDGQPVASPEADQWYELLIPMADFHAGPGASFVGISVGFGYHAVDVYLDDIRLELAAAAP